MPHAFLLAKCAENYVVLHVTDEGIRWPAAKIFDRVSFLVSINVRMCLD